jgi:hypothetical protein
MPVIPSEPQLNLDPIKAEVKQYVTLKDEIATMETRVKQLKTRITTAVEAMGETNDKGHIVLDLGEGDSIKSVVKQRRVSKGFDEATANNILKARNVYDTCTKVVTVLDQDAVMAAYYDGTLTDEDIDQMFPEKVSWALILEK